MAPANPNFLKPLNAIVRIGKNPNVSYFMQRTNASGMFAEPARFPNPNVKLPFPGDHVKFDPLIVEFKVDVDLANYMEIYNWIDELSYVQSTDQYADLIKHNKDGLGIYSDISLYIYTNEYVPNIKVTYIDAFPVGLSGLKFDLTGHDIEHINAEATFAFSYFTIEKMVTEFDS